MITRRTFLKASLAGAATVLASGNNPIQANAAPAFVSQRPGVADRKFTSPAVEAYIQSVQSHIADPELAWMFGNCFPNTLDTTVHFREKDENGEPDTFVITGDIPAMWLRDSSAQVWPYVPLIKKDPQLQRLFQGVINRHVRCILLDPYANAFLEDPAQRSEWASDYTTMKPGIHEHKWEVDSLCYPIRLAHGYWKATGDATPFDNRWESAMDLIVQTFQEQQRKTGHGPYHFQRGGSAPDLSLDSSYGRPIKPVGLIYSEFRSSDDETQYPFLIPSNFFAVVSLRLMAEMHRKLRHNDAKARVAESLANEIESAIKQYALHTLPDGRQIWAYEIDALGNANIMDDTNVPSLLSLPYFGACPVTDPIYSTTRKFLWSTDDPVFTVGKYSGIGSVHTGPNTVWPLSLIVYGLTSRSQDEVAGAIATLKATHAGTGFIHESFNKDNPYSYSRPWFAWANSLFGELIVQTLKTYPAVLNKTS